MRGTGSLTHTGPTAIPPLANSFRHLAPGSGCAVMAVSGQPALAQAYQCRMPATGVGAGHRSRWSGPRGCRSPDTRSRSAGRRSSARTGSCAAGTARNVPVRNGRFGFVVHGLWPESRRGSSGSWPQWCPAAGALTPNETRRNLCMMPSPRLVARQWAKHGSCMTRRPETYFKVTRILWDSLVFPDMDRLSREPGLTAGEIRNRNRLGQQGIEPENIGIDLDRGGWLEEVRICYGKRFRPAPCDRMRFGAGDRSAGEDLARALAPLAKEPA